MRHFLDFEKPIAELEGMIEELRQMSEPGGINITEEVAKLTEKADKQLRATYAKLTPWQKAQVARHPDRPHALACINGLVTGYTPLAGDRAFGDDAAVVGGLGRFGGGRWWCWEPSVGPTPKAACGTISAWRGRRATGNPAGWWNWPGGSACRS